MAVQARQGNGIFAFRSFFHFIENRKFSLYISTRHKRSFTQNVQVFVGSHNAGISGAVGSQPGGGAEEQLRQLSVLRLRSGILAAPDAMIYCLQQKPTTVLWVRAGVGARTQAIVCVFGVCVAEPCDNAQWHKVQEKFMQIF